MNENIEIEQCPKCTGGTFFVTQKELEDAEGFIGCEYCGSPLYPTKNPPSLTGEQETGEETCNSIVPQDDPRTDAERAHDEAGEAWQETQDAVRPC